MIVHPKIDDFCGKPYGEVKKEWVNVPDSRGCYEVGFSGEIRNKKRGTLLKPMNTGRVAIRADNGKKRKRRIYHIILESYFPHIPQNGRTADHIDENHQNNYITNLWWLTRPQNSTKSNQLRPRNHGGAQSKPILQWSKDKTELIAEFPSLLKASQETKVRHGDISNCARGKCLSAGGYFWEFKEVESQKDLEGEIWATNDVLRRMLRERNEKMTDDAISKVRISNLGRILTARGIKHWGKKVNDFGGTGHRHYGDWLVHQLVWAVWGDGSPVPKKGSKLVICHNDDIPKDKEGCVLNAIQYLRVDTEIENQREYQRAKAKKRTFTTTQELENVVLGGLEGAMAKTEND